MNKIKDLSVQEVQNFLEIKDKFMLKGKTIPYKAAIEEFSKLVCCMNPYD